MPDDWLLVVLCDPSAEPTVPPITDPAPTEERIDSLADDFNEAPAPPRKDDDFDANKEAVEATSVDAPDVLLVVSLVKECGYVSCPIWLR